MKIQVCDRSKFVTDKILAETFAKYGTVSSAAIVKDKVTGQSKRFGFVEMPDDAAGKAAIRALNHTQIFKIPIRVKEANTGKFTPSTPSMPSTGHFDPHERGWSGPGKGRVSLDGRPITPRPVVNPRPVYKGKPVASHAAYVRREKSEFKPEYRKQHGPHRNEHARAGFEPRDTFKLPDAHPFKKFSR